MAVNDDVKPTPANKAIEVACRGFHAATAAVVTYYGVRLIGHSGHYLAVEVSTLTAGVAYYEADLEGRITAALNRLAPKGQG